jgi:hypothetical protein
MVERNQSRCVAPLILILTANATIMASENQFSEITGQYYQEE